MAWLPILLGSLLGLCLSTDPSHSLTRQTKPALPQPEFWGIALFPTSLSLSAYPGQVRERLRAALERVTTLEEQLAGAHQQVSCTVPLRQCTLLVPLCSFIRCGWGQDGYRKGVFLGGLFCDLVLFSLWCGLCLIGICPAAGGRNSGWSGRRGRDCGSGTKTPVESG